jgi:hypothetical protein
MFGERTKRVILDSKVKIGKRKTYAEEVRSPISDGVWEIGANYLIRTVTMIDTGRLVRVTEHELVLEDAAWIADTGRYADALQSGDFNEVEPFPDGQVIVGRGAIIDAVKIPKVPRDQK